MDKEFNVATTQAQTFPSGRPALASGRDKALRYLAKMRGRSVSPPCP